MTKGRRHACRWILGLLLVTSTARADPVPPGCSLAWPEVLRNFAPGTGWALVRPPVPFSIREEGRPEYQAHVLQSRREARTAVIIAEWGDPGSPNLGPIVYCAVLDARGDAVEEIGTNPLDARTMPRPCAECA